MKAKQKLHTLDTFYNFAYFFIFYLGKCVSVALAFLPREPHEQCERQNNMTIEDEVSNVLLGKSREMALERMERLGQNGNHAPL